MISKKKNRIGKFYSCGVHGHIAASCRNGEIKLSHQKGATKGDAISGMHAKETYIFQV